MELDYPTLIARMGYDFIDIYFVLFALNVERVWRVCSILANGLYYKMLTDRMGWYVKQSMPIFLNTHTVPKLVCIADEA